MGAIEDEKIKLRKILPEPASKVATRIVVGPGGRLEISALSAIEDLLDDYEFFINLETKSENEEEEKRFLRAACFSLNAYIEGSVNSLYEIHARRNRIGKKKRKRHFHSKCEELENHYLDKDKNGHLNDIVRKELRNLRNELTHFSKGDNFLVWENLTISTLENQKQVFSSWINSLYKHMNVKPIRMSDEVGLIQLILAKLGLLKKR